MILTGHRIGGHFLLPHFILLLMHRQSEHLSLGFIQIDPG